MSDDSAKNIGKLLMAWQTVWRSRCCPPVDVLDRDQGKEALIQHMELCPWCREAVNSGAFKTAASLSEKIRHLSRNTSLPTPSPGMIFFLDPELGGWGRGGRYVNPPSVLVISPPQKSLVTVAQISAFPPFAGPGDIPLGNGLYGFAQAWNIYRLAPSAFFMLSADTGDASANAVMEAMIDQVDERGPEPGSLIWFFRHLELETGKFISARSCFRAPGRCDLLYVSSSQLVSDLSTLGFHVSGDISENSSPDHIILAAQPPENMLPMAAAGGGSEGDIETSALLFHMEQGRVTDVDAVQVTLTFSDYTDGIYRITGRLVSPFSRAVEQAHLHWLIRIDTEHGSLRPIPGMNGSHGTMFWAAFSIPGASMVRAHDFTIRITAHYR